MFLGMTIFQIQFKLLLGNFKEFLNGNGGKKDWLKLWRCCGYIFVFYFYKILYKIHLETPM